jgi:hypothetical protein
MCVTKENFTDCNVCVKKALLSRAIILLVLHPPHVALSPPLPFLQPLIIPDLLPIITNFHRFPSPIITQIKLNTTPLPPEPAPAHPLPRRPCTDRPPTAQGH